jgi:peptidyl-prolyl cis-trans isomerase D
MLQNIRDNLTGKTALIVLAVIALSFVFVGGASFTTLGSNYAAKVDGVDIGIAQFESVYREQLQANPQLATLPPESRKLYRTNILEQLIQQRVVDNYINEAGFEVSDEQLTKVVHRIPDFQVDGRFDRDTYESVLALNPRDSKLCRNLRCGACNCSVPFLALRSCRLRIIAAT